MILLCAAACAPAPKPSATGSVIDPNVYARAARLVRVAGSRRLNLVCVGSGAPAVILEAGAADASTIWRAVQGQMGAFTQVCAYDRAGFGYSDPIDRPSNLPNTADDLRRLLTRAGVKPPVVLVGHSLGGFYATLYADLHPAEVAGMVLLDPSFAGQQRDFDAARTAGERAALASADTAAVQRMAACAALARAGRKAALVDQGCPRIPQGLPAGVAAALGAVFAQPKYYDAMLSQGSSFKRRPGQAFSQDDRAEMAAARPFVSMPLVVFTAGGIGLGDNLAPAWKTGHDRLAARSTRGRSIVLADSGHYIQVDEPNTVIQAVREVVETVRTEAGR